MRTQRNIPPRTPPTSQRLEGLSQGYRAPSANPVDAFAEGELEGAERDGETLLDLIVQNAREGRWGSSRLKDPERLEAKGAGKVRPATPEGASPERLQEPRVEPKNTLSSEILQGIQATRSEVNLVTKAAGPSPLERLDDQLQNNRELMRHV